MFLFTYYGEKVIDCVIQLEDQAMYYNNDILAFITKQQQQSFDQMMSKGFLLFLCSWFFVKELEYISEYYCFEKNFSSHDM